MLAEGFSVYFNLMHQNINMIDGGNFSELKRSHRKNVEERENRSGQELSKNWLF